MTMEKHNVMEATRTPCCVCGKPAVNDEPTCDLHEGCGARRDSRGKIAAAQNGLINMLAESIADDLAEEQEK